MAAYIIVSIDVKDRETYARYIEMAPSSLKAYGGKYIVRAGATEVLEGDWQPKRLVVLQFDTMEQAKAWWSSDEYHDAKLLRQSAAHTQMLLADGYEG